MNIQNKELGQIILLSHAAVAGILFILTQFENQ